MTVLENVQMALMSHAGALSACGAPRAGAIATRRWRCSRRSAWRRRPSARCSVLAYGDVKRVELAIALANRPRLLLMDEPTAGMAPQERNELMALTSRARRASATSACCSPSTAWTWCSRTPTG